jgi:ubiquitin carboxyl-terminal hydrolase 34
MRRQTCRGNTDSRRYAFGDLFAGDLHPDVICCDFLSSYVRLCSILFLADVSLLARPRPDDVFTLPLLSQKHIQCLYKIFRPDKAPVFLVLQKEYSASPKLMSNRLQKDFIKANGAQNLLRLAHAMFHQVPPATQNTYALIVSQLLWFMFWHTSGTPAGDTYVDRAEYYRGVLRFFQTYSRDLQDASKVTDANSARDLIQHYGNLLHELLKRDRKILAEVEEDLLAFSGPDSPTSSPPVAPVTSPSGNYRQDPAFLPGLAMTAWKFKILSKYIVKGNMALRVLALATMDAALLDIWKEFNISDLGAQHPFMQYLADFLLQSRLVDYIVSVDSHPQLISRSGNIVGFLIVTCRWSDEQADAIWRTVSNSPDPRVVTATIGMLRTICNLMQPMALLYFCMKLHDLPIDRYNMDILRFLRELSLRLAEKTDSTEDFDQRGPDARPWNVCVRMMRDTAPSRLSNKSTSDLFMEANDQIHYWISTIPLHERHAIYLRCAQHIADRSSKATGSVRVMYLLIAAPDHGDDEFFQQNRTLIRCVLEEISEFIEAEKVAGPYSLQLQALECRLDLLRVIICRPAIQIPVDLYESLWDHVVGVHAISTAARDLAWTKFLEANRGSPGNALCQQLISTYVPAMPPALYTLEMFTFVASYTFPLTRRKIQSGQGEKSVLQIPGADLLWAMLLSSPCDIIADRAARHLARRYADIIDSLDVALPEVEDAHVALVQLCMQEISVALGTQSSPALESLGTDNKDVRGGEQLQQVAEIRTRRILLFLKLLLDFVRRKPEYNRGHRIDSKVDDLVSNIPFGDAITIRYQCGNDRQSVTMAADHSLNDLHTRLCDATGYTNVNLFARGQRLKLAEQGAFKVSEVDFGGQVIVQRADGANRTRSTAAPVGGSSVFEASIIKHFDEVFSWMNSDSQTSFLVSVMSIHFSHLTHTHQLYDFLSVFPVRGTFADSVTQDAISSKDLFPAGKVYQARYAAQDLENRLQTQIRNVGTFQRPLSRYLLTLQVGIE